MAYMVAAVALEVALLAPLCKAVWAHRSQLLEILNWSIRSVKLSLCVGRLSGRDQHVSEGLGYGLPHWRSHCAVCL